MLTSRAGTLLLAGLLAATRAGAQHPTGDDCLHFLPGEPEIVGQTAASERLHLFGDASAPAYRDADRDGVDDRRAARLLRRVVGDGNPQGGAGRELILQYWTIYGYNDGANNHEGDWEHLNLPITERRHARPHPPGPHRHPYLSADDVASIPDPASPLPLDPPVLREVAYDFHNNVVDGECEGCRVTAERGDLAMHVFLAW